MRYFIFWGIVIAHSFVKSQGLFFNDIKGSKWISENYSDSLTFNQKSIGLYKLRTFEDSIKNPVYLWYFNEQIEINYYNPALNEYNLILKLKYEIAKEKNKQYLRVYLNKPNQEYIDYDVGIVSTGNFVMLFKRQKKK